MLRKNVSLKPFNTFSIDVSANYFAEITETQHLRELLNFQELQHLPKLILGGGSNVLLTHNFNGLVLLIAIKGIRVIAENEHTVCLAVGAGENWHDLVTYCVEQGYAGIENLSLIPGTVGAAPIQNIGAYGVEFKDVFCELKAMDIQDGQFYSFDHEACQFGYRNSIFKNKLKDQFVITEVTLQLNKHPQFHLHYAGVQNMLNQMGVTEPNLQSVSHAISKIRQLKLPDPQTIANAGSFFKNPIINEQKLIALQNLYSNVPYYSFKDNQFKISAAWLIEQCGWKGYRNKDAGVYALHALVLVNYGCATGIEIKQLADTIAASVQKKFGIQLEPEVNIIPATFND